MKNSIKISFIVLSICILIACNTALIKKSKDIATKVLATVAYAYGGPYGELVGGFFDILSSERKHKTSDVMHSERPANQEENYDEQQAQNEQEYDEDQGQDEQYYEDQGQDEQEYYEDQGQDEQYYEDQAGEEQYAQNQGYQQDQTQSASQGGYTQPVHGGGRPLEVSIDIVREVFANGRYQAVKVRNGDTLTQQDNYKILFQSRTPCYMYIAQLDATGKMDPIMPSRFTPHRNPIRAGTLYDVPSQSNWFFLDANRGVETIYFIASKRPRPDIKQLFRKLEHRNRNLIRQKRVSMDTPYVATRGIGGIRPGGTKTLSFKNGSQGQYTATLIKSIKADFVMTRWFHHR